jgi:2-polyprenyl-3-methyl-5-hydroxy-6-metoxy-1,4-benzoquinol methylase
VKRSDKPDPAGLDPGAVRSYRHFRRLLSRHTSESLRGLYDRGYYTRQVGSREFADLYFSSGGLAPTPYTELPLTAGEVRSGERVLDLGCGRGELVFQAADRGAHAVGVDFAESAIEIARETREGLPAEVRARTDFVLGRADEVSFPNGAFDKVFLVDVAEHVTARELVATLREARRVLAPGGRIVVHTTPNRWSRSYGHWLRALAHFARGRRPPPDPIVAELRRLDADPRYDARKLFMHVNEHSVLSLKLAFLRAGLRSRITIATPGGPRRAPGMRRAALTLAYRLLGLKLVFGTNLLGVARDPRSRIRS